jgi:minor extracellular serine protease Vpr
VGWEPKTRMVWIVFNSTEINMWIDKPQAKVNNILVWIDPSNHAVSPIIQNDRTFVPIRFVAENLGCTVLWDDSTKTVTIIYKE